MDLAAVDFNARITNEPDIVISGSLVIHIPLLVSRDGVCHVTDSIHIPQPDDRIGEDKRFFFKIYLSDIQRLKTG